MELEPPYDSDYITVLHQFIRKRVEIAGARKVLVGLSGGLDSTVVAKLVADALGKDRVICLLMPVKDTRDTEEGKSLAEEFGIEYRLVHLEKDFQALLDSYSRVHKLSGNDLLRLAPGNLSSRLRMASLYFAANLMGGLVMGTSNKTELLTGYFTKYGDGGSDAMPLGDLYKTQVYRLAEEIGVPGRVIIKKPTAGFYQGQTDEDELGVDYATLDKVLYGLELRFTSVEIAERLGLDSREPLRIEKMVQKAAHKRSLGMIPKLGLRTPGFDWRENMDYGLE